MSIIKNLMSLYVKNYVVIRFLSQRQQNPNTFKLKIDYIVQCHMHVFVYIYIYKYNYVHI